MRNVFRLFANDMKRITGNVVTTIIVLGLIFLPSIFSWYNVLASWDVFGNSGNITVAVANNDTGYKSDLIPLPVNIGAQVESGLRANDELNWVFVSEEEAIDGTRSGEYYAAIVIPEGFSRDMMTFYEDDSENAQVIYYTNEKKSAIAPKVTDQDASKVSYEINVAFTETLTDAGLNILSELADYADTSGASGTVTALADHIDTLGSQMGASAGTLRSYADVIGSAKGLVSGSSALLDKAQSSAHSLSAEASNAQDGVSSISEALGTAATALGDAVESTERDYEGVEGIIDDAFAQAGEDSAAAAKSLRDASSALQEKNVHYAQVESSLKDLKAAAPAEYADTLDSLIVTVQNVENLNEALIESLDTAATDIEQGSADANAHMDDAKEQIAQAKKSLADLKGQYNDTISPELDQLSGEVSSLVDSLAASASHLDATASSLSDDTGSVESSLEDAQTKLNGTADKLAQAQTRLFDVAGKIRQALASGDSQALKDVLGTDPDLLANLLASPVQMDRIAVFPADNFGSQMAPLYTTLAVWIGSLLSVVAIKVNVSKKQRAELDDPKPRELFFGRFGVFAFVSLAQTTTMALGNMVFLGVQAVHPLLYMICFWTGGLVFTFMMYVLVLSFANLGKAIGVLLLILQVTAGGGSFPLQMFPSFFQIISPYIPATHMINAMRAAMMGVYQNDFWIEIGMLLLFVVPMLLLGLALRKPLERFLKWYVGKVDESRLVS